MNPRRRRVNITFEWPLTPVKSEFRYYNGVRESMNVRKQDHEETHAEVSR